jgi:hypothetical protein
MNRAIGNKVGGKKQPKLQPLKEFFRLKYLRFKCRDINKTIDFYKSLGMTIDYEGEQDAFRPPVPGDKQNNQKVPTANTMESSHVKKNPNLKAEAEGESVSNGGPCGRILALSFVQQANGPVAKEIQNQRVQLIFEEDLDYHQEMQINQLKEKAKIDNQAKVAEKNDQSATLDKSKREYEYLVIYVHFLPRILKRMESKGFEIVLDITSFENVKIAILKDPNQIQIRLMELPDSYLNDSGAKQWFARLGYYTLPSSNADETVLMYESYFQTRVQKQNIKSEKEKDKGNSYDDPKSQSTNLRKLGPALTVKQALAKGTGFRLVDMDDFVVGLTNSVFYWMGNDMRTASCCLCITEVSNADTGVAYTSYDPEKSRLKAIGRY